MSAFSLATRYAKSLIQLVNEQGRLEQVYKDIKDVNAIFESNRDLKLMFKSPIIHTDRKLNVVQQLFEGKIDSVLYQFITLVIKKGREAYLNEITHSFILQYNELKNITPVKISSAIKLDENIVKGIIDTLKKNEKLGEVELTEEVDANIIGGFVLQWGDKMIDSSVSRRLSTLKGVIEDDSFVKKYS
jgi:F-type H+-transporting ATPase subunit delta